MRIEPVTGVSIVSMMRPNHDFACALDASLGVRHEVRAGIAVYAKAQEGVASLTVTPVPE
ncbi:hypothetical protein [Sphingomonas aracearum]|uniref:hypothetical protein n=1 Tax=Sphingomonas aracearum TaxID=2283317 RepID=UPI0011C07E5D|nr:hypothetical protein [Sphingomonas aracearum]